MTVLDFLGLGDAPVTEGASYGSDTWTPPVDHVNLNQGGGGNTPEHVRETAHTGVPAKNNPALSFRF
jgi:hypothetical protein